MPAIPPTEGPGKTLADGSQIDYSYDEKRQLTGAQSDTDAAYDYGYSFDPIGNWLSGDIGQSGGAPVAKTFTPNALNQYTAVNTATFTHDPNGNLTNDGTRAYAWDEENRLVATNGSSFVYDGMSRRIDANGVRYLYDGLLPIAELDTNNAYTRTVTRGLDLSGTLQGAGGIGGILATVTPSVTGYYFYDGNGNVVDVLDPSGTVIAHYTYDPFGNKVAESGSYATQPYQWSTKEHDQSSGLVYYLYRFYNPQIGRWINRDPIGELEQSTCIV